MVRNPVWAWVRRHKVTVGLLAVGLLIVAWGAGAALKLFSAREQALAAEAGAREAAELVGSGDLESARGTLQEAVASLDSAGSWLASLWVGPLRLVPFLGTELRASEAGIAGTRSTLLAALGLLDYVLADREPVYDAGQLRPAGLEALGRALEEALGHAADARTVLSTAPQPRSGLIAHRLEEAGRVTADVHDVLKGASTLVDRLGEAASGGRPYRLLLLLENGAERRATGGLAGWYALVEVDREGIHLPAFGSVVGALQLVDEAGGFLAVEAPADYLQRYEQYQANTTLWANVNLSPDFPTVAGVVRRLYGLATGIEVDAVARADLTGLGYILSAFPGLTVEGRELDASTLATGFLMDSYQRFPDDTRPGEQNAYLGAALQEVVGQVFTGIWADRSEVFRAVRRTVAERRVSVVTGDPGIDAMLAAVGADGALLPGGPGDVMVTTQNFATNKIDFFTETHLAVGIGFDGCRVAGKISLTLTNATPGGLEWLPHGSLGNAGRWMVSIYLPPGAVVGSLELDGALVEGTIMEELGRPVVSLTVDAALAESVEFEVRWEEQVTGRGYTLTVRPQPLVVPARLAVNGEAAVPLVETYVREFADVCVG